MLPVGGGRRPKHMLELAVADNTGGRRRNPAAERLIADARW